MRRGSLARFMLNQDGGRLPRYILDTNGQRGGLPRYILDTNGQREGLPRYMLDTNGQRGGQWLKALQRNVKDIGREALIGALQGIRSKNGNVKTRALRGFKEGLKRGVKRNARTVVAKALAKRPRKKKSACPQTLNEASPRDTLSTQNPETSQDVTGLAYGLKTTSVKSWIVLLYPRPLQTRCRPARRMGQSSLEIRGDQWTSPSSLSKSNLQTLRFILFENESPWSFFARFLEHVF